jgi:hypothetical protein
VYRTRRNASPHQVRPPSTISRTTVQWLTPGACLLLREKDWASTPLGPIAQWPNTLKIALAICLFTRFPFVRFAHLFASHWVVCWLF